MWRTTNWHLLLRNEPSAALAGAGPSRNNFVELKLPKLAARQRCDGGPGTGGLKAQPCWWRIPNRPSLAYSNDNKHRNLQVNAALAARAMAGSKRAIEAEPDAKGAPVRAAFCDLLPYLPMNNLPSFDTARTRSIRIAGDEAYLPGT